MKKFTLILICLVWFLSFAMEAQTATQPSGDGSAANPYQIATLNNLYWVTQNSSSWSKDFVQTANIDASGTSSWNSNTGFTNSAGGTGKTTWVTSGWPAQTELTVNTTEISNVGATTADVSGSISFEGSSPVTAKGVVWDTTNNPTLQDHLGITNKGGDTTSFTSKLSGLSDTTVYYVRAYAVNSQDTAYGAVKSLITMSPPPTMVPPGNALKFDGTGYVTLPNESNFDFTHAMTVAAWIKVNAFTRPLLPRGIVLGDCNDILIPTISILEQQPVRVATMIWKGKLM